MNKGRLLLFWALLATAAACLLFSVRQPLWKMRMEAPQYRGEEALRVAVFPTALRGDLSELKTLNQYIGVHVPNELPQFKWLPAALVAGALLPLAGALLRKGRTRTIALFAAPVLLSATLGFAAVQARAQMHEIGHNRDKKTILAGVKDFTPPFLGRAKIAQFEITSEFGFGTVLAAVAVALQITAGALTHSTPLLARIHRHDTTIVISGTAKALA
jgi:hypothetical protein